jgi:hypothetical protein
LPAKEVLRGYIRCVYALVREDEDSDEWDRPDDDRGGNGDSGDSGDFASARDRL